MIESDKPQFVAALTELALLKGTRLTPESFGAWWNSMREKWTLAEFRSACAHLRDSHEFMPNPFHFEQLRRASRETAGEAFARARAYARTLSVSGGFLQESPSGDEFLDTVARAIGGYRAIANASDRDLQFIERRFAEHFETISEAGDVREAVPWLGDTRRALLGPKSFAELLARPQ